MNTRFLVRAIKVRAIKALTAAIIASSLAGTAFAQVEAGRFVGRITDPQGAVVVHATVRVTNMGTNSVQSAFTDSDGNYL